MLDIFYGLAATLIGIYFVWSTARKPPPSKSYYSSTRFKAYAGGIILIMVGLVIILKKLFQLF